MFILPLSSFTSVPGLPFACLLTCSLCSGYGKEKVMKEANILSATRLDIELPSSESEGHSDMLSNFASLENRTAVLHAAPSEPTLTSFYLQKPPADYRAGSAQACAGACKRIRLYRRTTQATDRGCIRQVNPARSSALCSPLLDCGFRRAWHVGVTPWNWASPGAIFDFIRR
jgi:hypothetical protein